MTEEELPIYRARLERERARLSKEVKKEEKPANFGDDIDHLDEEADEAEEFGSQLAISHDLKIRINEIDLALNRISNGAYGRCTNCGKPIEKKVLDAAPESRLCLTCKKEIARSK